MGRAYLSGFVIRVLWTDSLGYTSNPTFTCVPPFLWFDLLEKPQAKCMSRGTRHTYSRGDSRGTRDLLSRGFYENDKKVYNFDGFSSHKTFVWGCLNFRTAASILKPHKLYAKPQNKFRTVRRTDGISFVAARVWVKSYVWLQNVRNSDDDSHHYFAVYECTFVIVTV